MAYVSRLAERRRDLQQEVIRLESALFDAGLVPVEQPLVDSDDEYGRLVQSLERHVELLRAQAFRANVELPEAPAASGPAGAGRASSRAPSDWMDRLADEQQARLAAEARATQAEMGRQEALRAAERASGVLPGVFAALASAVGVDGVAAPAAAGPRQVESGGDEDLSTVELTRMVLQAHGPKVALAAGEVTDGVRRVSSGEVNAGTVRSNLARMRDRGECGNDPASGLWWLIDPAEPDWRPSRLRVVADEGR